MGSHDPCSGVSHISGRLPALNTVQVRLPTACESRITVRAQWPLLSTVPSFYTSNTTFNSPSATSVLDKKHVLNTIRSHFERAKADLTSLCVLRILPRFVHCSTTCSFPKQRVLALLDTTNVDIQRHRF